MTRAAFLAMVLLLLVPVLLPRPEPQSTIRLVDTATESGIAASIYCGAPEKRWIPEANGSGCAALDYDNDGWMDLVIVNGSSMERLREIVAGKKPAPARNGIYLYRNLGNGRFQDVTAQSGLFNPYWGTGVNVADFDNDGYADILITTIGIDLLFKNNGDGTFSEVGAAAGLSRAVHWHTGSSFADYDGDGQLDLYIAGYVDPHSIRWTDPAPVCDYRGLPVFCGPRELKGEKDVLLRNNGDGTFTDVTERARVTDSAARYGFTVVFDDFNGDGKPDIFVANDSGPNFLYLNQGNGTFQEAALASGVAYNADGNAQANMGVAVGDYNNDGYLDLLTTTFSEDYFPLFTQFAPGLYEDRSAQAGLGMVTRPYLGWACGFVDLDNDGDKDLWLANGHVYPTADKLGSTTYLQPVAIFENIQGRFNPVKNALSGAPKNSWRGGCAADSENDGKVDIVVVPISGTPMLLSNRTQTQNSWIGLSLKGARSNRDGIGARVRIEHCGSTQFDSVRNGGSYVSRNDPRLHFGLGRCSKVDRVTITWPDGTIQVLNNLRPNQYMTVRQSSIN